MFGCLAVVTGLFAVNLLIETVADGLPAWLVIGGGLAILTGLCLYATRPGPDLLMGGQTRVRPAREREVGLPSGGRSPQPEQSGSSHP